MPQPMSTRWCPTPQQLMILEDMYRAGIRTPKASQIQQITAHLSFYGKIEGKNVFYWFQNHKARERQKLRKRMMKELQHQYLLDRARDCAADLRMQPHQYFFHHQQEDNGPLNFMCKVSTPEVEKMRSPAAIVGGGLGGGGGGGIHEWVTLELSPPSCCRPLQTLELFPITTTGLKEEKTATNSPTSTTHGMLFFQNRRIKPILLTTHHLVTRTASPFSLLPTTP